MIRAGAVTVEDVQLALAAKRRQLEASAARQSANLRPLFDQSIEDQFGHLRELGRVPFPPQPEPDTASGSTEVAAVFDACRLALYRTDRPNVRRVDALDRLAVWESRALEAATDRNAQLRRPLPDEAVQAIADAVALWVWHRWESGEWSVTPGPHRAPELQAARGIKSGEARRRSVAKLARLAVRLARSGCRQSAVARACRKSVGWVRHVIRRDAPDHRWTRGRPAAGGRGADVPAIMCREPMLFESLPPAEPDAEAETRVVRGRTLELPERGPPDGAAGKVSGTASRCAAGLFAALGVDGFGQLMEVYG